MKVDGVEIPDIVAEQGEAAEAALEEAQAELAASREGIDPSGQTPNSVPVASLQEMAGEAVVPLTPGTPAPVVPPVSADTVARADYDKLNEQHTTLQGNITPKCLLWLVR